MAAAVATATLLACVAPAWAAGEPPAASREVLLDLADVLGRSHAIRQACEGAQDQFWRIRMTRLLDAHPRDPDLVTAMAEQFNRAFAAAQQDHHACDEAAQAEAARLARRGRQLSNSLAQP